MLVFFFFFSFPRSTPHPHPAFPPYMPRPPSTRRLGATGRAGFVRLPRVCPTCLPAAPLCIEASVVRRGQWKRRWWWWRVWGGVQGCLFPAVPFSCHRRSLLAGPSVHPPAGILSLGRARVRRPPPSRALVNQSRPFCARAGSKIHKSLSCLSREPFKGEEVGGGKVGGGRGGFFVR